MKNDEMFGINLFLKICQSRQHMTHAFRRSVCLGELYGSLVIAEEDDRKLNVDVQELKNGY
jgi:hypothetical protein